jgi:hypothetical protein
MLIRRKFLVSIGPHSKAVNIVAVRGVVCSPGSGRIAAEQAVQHAEWIGQCLGRPEFAPLEPDDIAELAALLREEHHPAGTTIVQIGDAPRRVGVVRHGAIALCRDLNGRRVMLQILRSGDAWGDIG